MVGPDELVVYRILMLPVCAAGQCFINQECCCDWPHCYWMSLAVQSILFFMAFLLSTGSTNDDLVLFGSGILGDCQCSHASIRPDRTTL